MLLFLRSTKDRDVKNKTDRQLKMALRNHELQVLVMKQEMELRTQSARIHELEALKGNTE